MKLVFKSEYYNISDFKDSIISNFSVISGDNGVGKTQLLKSIQNGNILIYDDKNIIIDKKNIVTPNIISQLNDVSINMGTFNFAGMNRHETESQKYYSFCKALEVNKNLTASYVITISNNIIDECKKFYNTPNTVQFEDFKYWIENIKVNRIDFQLPRITQIIRSYHILKIENKYNKFLNKEGENISFLSDEQFINKYGNDPIDEFNNILSKIKPNYQFKKIEISKKEYINTYIPKILDVDSNKVIEFSMLSTGESRILRLYFTLYILNKKNELDIKVILLDEFDSGLHPSVIKTTYDILRAEFVEKNNLSLICTTHSPTTIAVSPKESIYLLKREMGVHSIISKNKNSVISNLTAEIPTLHINPNKRTIVLTESSSDSQLYNELTCILLKNNNLKIDNSISFIASGTQKSENKGSCENVKSILSSFRKNGSTNVFGIIDWDNKNKSDTSSGLIVNCEQTRYSIESLILDPLFVGILLIRLQKSSKYNIPVELFTDIKYDKQILQSIIDSVISHFDNLSSKRINIQYGEIMLSVSYDILTMKGHNLSEIYHTLFPIFKSSNIKNLMLEIINTVIKEFPLLIPSDFIQTLSKLKG